MTSQSEELPPPFAADRDHWRGGDGVVILEGTPGRFVDGRPHLSGYDTDTLRAAVESNDARG